MRIVLDTNVLVSAILTPAGAAHQILQLVFRGDLQACVDPRIKAEYREVLARGKFDFPQKMVEQFLEGLLENSTEVIAAAIPGFFPDEDDRVFVEVALAAHAQTLITGNARHFQGAKKLGLRVVTPREFLKHLRSSR